MIFSFRGYETWEFIWKSDFNEFGDFLAGVFTPVAFGWLIYGYFLQRNELRLQREELYLQRNELRLQYGELKETRKTLGVQVKMMKDQADRDSDRNMAMGIRPKMGR